MLFAVVAAMFCWPCLGLLLLYTIGDREENDNIAMSGYQRGRKNCHSVTAAYISAVRFTQLLHIIFPSMARGIYARRFFPSRNQSDWIRFSSNKLQGYTMLLFGGVVVVVIVLGFASCRALHRSSPTITPINSIFLLVIVRLHRTIPLNHTYHVNLCSSTIK